MIRNHLEPLKEEALRELEAIYDHQKKNPWATRTTDQKTSDSVARAIKRLHQHLTKAANTDGNPNEVLRAFADHIKQYILIPSGRGYPIVWTDVLEPYGTTADADKHIAVFGALCFWWIGEHGTPRMDTSEHVWFANDQLAVRFIEEIDFDYAANDATAALLTAAS